MDRDHTDAAEPPLIHVEDGSVATLRLNRPDRLNAVSLPLYRALEAVLADLARNHDVRALILTGTGRAFCAGADMKAYGDHAPEPEERREYALTGQRVYRQLQTIPKPVVAAVNGHAIGAGLELALSCDFIVVAEDAKLRFPELALGTFVGGGTVYTLRRRVGLARAKELIMLGGFFSGRAAAEIGLANRAVPADRVLTEATALAEALAARAPIPMGLAKRLLHRAYSIDPDEALEEEAAALLECMQSRDWREGVRAFAEKRVPDFHGE